MMTYEPRPGGVAERALAALSELPPGSPMTRRELADAVGVTAENLEPNLATAIKHGAIIKVRVDGGPVFFRLPSDADRPGPRGQTYPAPPEPESEALVAGRFVALLDTDGEMEVFGGAPIVTPQGVTGVRLSDDDVLQLRRLLNGTLVDDRRWRMNLGNEGPTVFLPQRSPRDEIPSARKSDEQS